MPELDKDIIAVQDLPLPAHESLAAIVKILSGYSSELSRRIAIASLILLGDDLLCSRADDVLLSVLGEKGKR